MKATAAQEAQALQDRVDALYAGTISMEDFKAQQREHWDRIIARGRRFDDKVRGLVCGGGFATPDDARAHANAVALGIPIKVVVVGKE